MVRVTAPVRKSQLDPEENINYCHFDVWPEYGTALTRYTGTLTGQASDKSRTVSRMVSLIMDSALIMYQ